VAEGEKQPFWKSLPGILTAATGFVAALSGLVAGLNQLGAFRREEPAAPVTAPAPRESTLREPAPAVRGESTSTGATPPSAAVPSTAATRRTPATTPAAAPAPRATTAPDSTSAEPRLPKGTTLELAVPARTCAPPDGQRRFTARLVAPVKVGGATVLPAKSTAVLHLRRAGSPPAASARLDSLVGQDLAASVSGATVRIRRGAAAGACLRADARLTATLGAPVTLRRR
jgi:hypothetical protein